MGNCTGTNWEVAARCPPGVQSHQTPRGSMLQPPGGGGDCGTPIPRGGGVLRYLQPWDSVWGDGEPWDSLSPIKSFWVLPWTP